MGIFALAECPFEGSPALQRPALVAFAKDPTRVAVKTRLGDTFGLQERCDIYSALLKDILQDLTEINAVDLYLACHPDKNSPYFEKLASQYELKLINQIGNDLGERMARCFDELLTHHSQVIIFGTDTPLIPLEEIEAALQPDKNKDWHVLLGSALDGGYYCIGLNSAKFDSCPNIFDSVTWSSESVLEKTLENCRANHFQVYEVSGTTDIDTVEDLKKLVANFDFKTSNRLKEVGKTLDLLGWSFTK